MERYIELFGHEVDTKTPEFKRFHAIMISVVNRIVERKARRLEEQKSLGKSNDLTKKKPGLTG
ncbi:MAG: hypothetical protein ACFFDF_00220 [Candidatus Odinarchaeota archaeon]